MSSQSSSYDIKDGLNILLSLPDNLTKQELKFIMRELNILRKMRHINSVMVVSNTSSTDSTNLYNDVQKLDDVNKENIHTSLLNIQDIQSNKTIFSNLLVICDYDKKNDMITNLKNNKLTDYLLITYNKVSSFITFVLKVMQVMNPNLVDDTRSNVINLLRVLVGLQTCFREPTNEYNRYGFNLGQLLKLKPYLLYSNNCLSVMLPNNDKNLLSNNNDRDEILYLENIIDNSSKTGYIESRTVRVSDDTQIGGKLGSTLKKMFRRNKKMKYTLKKPKKIKTQLTTADIKLKDGDNRANYSFMKNSPTSPYAGRKVYDSKKITASGKHPMRNSIIAKSADYAKLKKFNNESFPGLVNLLIKKIDLSEKNNSISDKVKTLEAKYDIIFNYSNMNILKLLDFVLFTDVGEPSLSTIKRYIRGDSNSEAVLSGKLNKKGKDAYKKAKEKRLTKRHDKIDKTKEKLTKKKTEVRKQSKLNYKLESDKKYSDLLAELEKLTGFKNILARRRVKAKLNKRKAEILKNLSDKERQYLNNNKVSAKAILSTV